MLYKPHLGKAAIRHTGMCDKQKNNLMAINRDGMKYKKWEVLEHQKQILSIVHVGQIEEPNIKKKFWILILWMTSV